MLPKGWSLVVDPSEVIVADATSRYNFHNRNGKPVKLEYGLGARNPMEKDVVSARFRNAFIKDQVDTSRIVFDDNPKLILLRKQGKFDISLLEVSGFNALVYEPKHFNNDISGIYIDSIGNVADNIAQLVLFGKNLDSLENLEIKQISSTLKLKHFE